MPKGIATKPAALVAGQTVGYYVGPRFTHMGVVERVDYHNNVARIWVEGLRVPWVVRKNGTVRVL
ncbi:MAG: hypothetical protein EBU08_05190 [Micrococcales bacterium]|nr:hypothetical protein [Micrococcales bacterium]